MASFAVELSEFKIKVVLNFLMIISYQFCRRSVIRVILLPQKKLKVDLQ
jgi:hypothetical protein